MTNNPIPIIEARGTHREVGLKIGEQCRSQIQDMLTNLRDSPPAGAAWEKMLDQSKEYLAHSRAAYPRYIEELEGLAEGSGVSFDEIFLSMCEELWESPCIA